MTGNVFHIQRFSTNDGPGIRTVVFLKGCPLSCAWCHNPESKSAQPELFFNEQKCLNCKLCQTVCPQHQHVFENDRHIFLRNTCKKCMKCVEICPANALEKCGEEKTADAVIEELLRDAEFYKTSGGGITLSGGEPLMQYSFSLAVLTKAKEHGIHTAVETSGYCHQDLSGIAPYVDVWLYDIKLISEQEHLTYTGISNQIIIKNLYALDSMNANLILRCPVIPEINFTKEHFREIAKLASSLKHVSAVHFEPYHPLGIDKAMRLNKTQEYQNHDFLSGDDILPLVQEIKEQIQAEIKIL